MTHERTPPTRDDRQAGRRHRLPSWRIGPTGGTIGMLCCVGPAVLGLLGLVSGATALTWATTLYDDDTWWVRLVGLAASAALTW